MRKKSDLQTSFGKLVKKHGTKSPSNLESSGKKWMDPKVRRTMNFIINRNAFDNKLVKRTTLEGLFKGYSKINRIAINKDPLVREKLLKDYIRKWIEKNISNKKLPKKIVLKELKKSVRHVGSRIDNYQKEIENLRIQGKKAEKNNEKEKAENLKNLIDGLAHLTQKFAIYDLYAIKIEKIIREIEKEEKRVF